MPGIIFYTSLRLIPSSFSEIPDTCAKASSIIETSSFWRFIAP